MSSPNPNRSKTEKSPKKKCGCSSCPGRGPKSSSPGRGQSSPGQDVGRSTANAPVPPSPNRVKARISVSDTIPGTNVGDPTEPDMNVTAGEILMDELLNNSNIIPYKVYNFGERGSGIHSKYPVQNYEVIKKECLKKGELFTDNTFDTDLSFLAVGLAQIEWKRPKEIIEGPVFYEKICRFGVIQQGVADCWMLASLAVIAMSDQHVAQVIPEGQSFDKDYAGIFHFRLWYYGKWIDVCVDDRLPCYDNTLIFAKSTNPKEFWSALLEKAFAKLFGKYGNIILNEIANALEVFTGGFSFDHQLSSTKLENLIAVLIQARRMNSVMGAAIRSKSGSREALQDDGLFRGHAYSITGLKIFSNTEAQNLNTQGLIRIRNPWGSEKKWKGAWSDNSDEWQALSEQQKKEMGLKFEHDGEWWMSIEDFHKKFSTLEVCHLVPLSKIFQNVETEWHVEEDWGVWLPGITAGGGMEMVPHLDKPGSYLQLAEYVDLNPQYVIKVEPSNRKDTNKARVLLSLHEKRERRNPEVFKSILVFALDLKSTPFPLGYEQLQPLLPEMAKYNIGGLSIKVKAVISLELEPGTYCVIPCCNGTTELREYYLRICSEKPAHLQKLENTVQMEDVITQRKYAPFWDNSLDDAKGEMRRLYITLAGEKDELTWSKLREYLNLHLRSELQEELSKNACKTIMALYDRNHSGGLDLDEFKKLMMVIIRLKSSFFKQCNKQNNMLDPKNLETTLEEAGIRISKDFLVSVAKKFGNSAYEITFDDFLMYCLKFYSFGDTFRSLRGRGKFADRKLELDKNEWMIFLMYS